jgi:DNA-binding response OmpR family regulator
VDKAELEAWMTSIIRRSAGFSQSKLHVGDLTLYLASREVRFIGLPVRLSDKEFMIYPDSLRIRARLLPNAENRILPLL